jgi:hypothetical protein
MAMRHSDFSLFLTSNHQNKVKDFAKNCSKCNKGELSEWLASVRLENANQKRFLLSRPILSSDLFSLSMMLTFKLMLIFLSFYRAGACSNCDKLSIILPSLLPIFLAAMRG